VNFPAPATTSGAAVPAAAGYPCWPEPAAGDGLGEGPPAPLLCRCLQTRCAGHVPPLIPARRRRVAPALFRRWHTAGDVEVNSGRSAAVWWEERRWRLAWVGFRAAVSFFFLFQDDVGDK